MGLYEDIEEIDIAIQDLEESISEQKNELEYYKIQRKKLQEEFNRDFEE